MDGRMDLSALERTRLLSSLSSGSLAHLSSSISGTSITDSVAQLRSAADRSSTETASPLLEYSRGFLPPGALFPPSSGYGAMMASYLTGSGHVPDSLKHLLPEMRQYWGATAHSESYARYLLGTMYNPYLPYLPATESLALFAQSSASSSQLEALHAHAAVQHRIYDLQKEALYGQGPFSPGLHPHLHLLHNPGGQAEPTNLSISSSKAKIGGEKRGHEEDIGSRPQGRARDSDSKDLKQKDNGETKERSGPIDGLVDCSKHCDSGSERTRGKTSKNDDKDRIKSSSKVLKSPPVRSSESARLARERTISPKSKRERSHSGNSLSSERTGKDKSYKHSPVLRCNDSSPVPIVRSSSTHSSRHSEFSPSLHSPKAHLSPVQKADLSGPSPVQSSFRGVAHAAHFSPKSLTQTGSYPRDILLTRVCVSEQEVPENLCIKDTRSGSSLEIHDAKVKTEFTDPICSRISIFSPLTVITSEVVTEAISKMSKVENETSPQTSDSRMQGHSPCSAMTTSTTYSLPYYHNLFSRSQTNDGKKVHATTYVPEIGTISSPVAGAPSVIQVKGQGFKSKLEENGDKDIVNSSSKRCGEHMNKLLLMKKDSDLSYQRKHDNDKDVVENDSIVLNETSSLNTCLIESTKSKLVKAGKSDKSNSVESHEQNRITNVARSEKHTKVRAPKRDPQSSDMSSNITIARLHSPGNKKTVSDRYGSEKTKIQSTENENGNNLHVQEVEETDKDGNVPKHEVPLSIIDMSDVITVSDAEDKDIEQKRDQLKITHISKLFDLKSKQNNGRQTKIVRPIPMSAVKPESPAKDGKSDSPPGNQDTEKTMLGQSSKADTPTQSCGIPIGIAVARQRSIAPKLTSDKEIKKNADEIKHKNPVADVKPMRPFKDIRPSTKGTANLVDKINELPANLIVTGGPAAPGMFWPDDPASRQLAAQLLQSSAALTPTSWYGQSSYPFPNGIPTSLSTVSGSNQLPYTVPAGLKLAQDSMGQIWLVPPGADMFDSNQLFGGGLHIGNHVEHTSAFTPSATFITGGQAPMASTLVTQNSLFTGNAAMTDRPEMSMQPFVPILGHNILPHSEITSIKDDAGQTKAEQSQSPVNVQTVLSTTSLGSDLVNNRQTLLSVAQPGLVIGERDHTGFQSSLVPIVFSPQVFPTPASHLSDKVEDHSEPTSLQSRGTSPMLPASDSCCEETKSDDNCEDIVDVCDSNHAGDEYSTDDVTLKEECKEIEKNSVRLSFNNHVDDTAYHEDGHCKVFGKTSLDNATKDSGGYESEATNRGAKTACPLQDMNNENMNAHMFKDIGSEYDPFKDPQVLQAVDGLELLSALAEKSAMVKKKDELKIELGNKRDPIHKQENVPLTGKKANTIGDPVVKKKSRVKFGFAYMPSKDVKAAAEEKKMTTLCGISIPEDDEVIDSIELEMKMRLAELQRRYKEKQRQLAKLTPKIKVKEAEDDAGKLKNENETHKGPGRPKKRSLEPGESSESAHGKSPKHKRADLCSHKSPPNTGSGSTSGHNGQPVRKKKLAEMLVDRVFRRTGSSFKIPLSKKINLIAPARIEYPGGQASSVEKPNPGRRKKSLDFGKLIKRSRLSQLGDKSEHYVGGFWNKKHHDNKHFLSDPKQKRLSKTEVGGSRSTRRKPHLSDTPSERMYENGLGLLAEYAAKSRDESSPKKRKSEPVTVNSPESPNKKRKPGRPKKCDSVQPGFTETIVAKQSKHMDFFRLQNGEQKQERKISLEGKTPLKPLYLDEWNVRRSERIFLSDPSPQTSPNTVSPGNQAPKNKIGSPATKSSAKVISPGSKITSVVAFNGGKGEVKQKCEKPKISQSLNMSMKVKKKYSSGLSQQQRTREKTAELVMASRERLEQKSKNRKIKEEHESIVDRHRDGSDSDDVPLSMFKVRTKIEAPDLPPCTLSANELADGLRILVFMDGLFHEGELKAIRPPDVYGAVLDNERKTRPHYYSQEEILKEAIKDTRPASAGQLLEGTRICAYWSQQFSCLYPGTIYKGSPNPSLLDRALYTVEFDDGDTGRIPLDHIRIIPQDFPIVDYDPNPLLLLTKRRRTTSVSEGSESRKSQSEPPRKTPSDVTKDPKIKRGPGRPPKAERLISTESVGDEDVFLRPEDGSSVDQGVSGSERRVVSVHPKNLWQWSGSSTKRPGMKGKAKKEYYKTVFRHKETISVGDCAVFISIGRPNLPYVGRIESFWETWTGRMVVKVKWFYHPEETKGGKRLQNMKGALFRSDHEDENDVQTISHKCDVIPYAEYRRRVDVISHDSNKDVYYLAGHYEPTVGNIKFESGVV